MLEKAKDSDAEFEQMENRWGHKQKPTSNPTQVVSSTSVFKNFYLDIHWVDMATNADQLKWHQIRIFAVSCTHEAANVVCWLA